MFLSACNLCPASSAAPRSSTFTSRSSLSGAISSRYYGVRNGAKWAPRKLLQKARNTNSQDGDECRIMSFRTDVLAVIGKPTFLDVRRQSRGGPQVDELQGSTAVAFDASQRSGNGRESHSRSTGARDAHAPGRIRPERRATTQGGSVKAVRGLNWGASQFGRGLQVADFMERETGLEPATSSLAKLNAICKEKTHASKVLAA